MGPLENGYIPNKPDCADGAARVRRPWGQRPGRIGFVPVPAFVLDGISETSHSVLHLQADVAPDFVGTEDKRQKQDVSGHSGVPCFPHLCLPGQGVQSAGPSLVRGWKRGDAHRGRTGESSRWGLRANESQVAGAPTDPSAELPVETP